jgi:hypothetical protein
MKQLFFAEKEQLEIAWKRRAAAAAARAPGNQPPQPVLPSSVRILFSNCSHVRLI